MRRILLWSTAVFAVLVTAALATIFLIDLSRFQPVVEARVEEALGSPVEIAGGLEIGRSLTPSLAASGVTVANTPGGSREHKAEIGRLEVGVELLPLLSGEIRVTHLIVAEADILLEIGADGRDNWTVAPEAGAAPSEPGAETQGAIAHIGRLELRNSTISRIGADGEMRRLGIERVILASRSERDPMELEIDVAVDGLPLHIEANTGSLADFQAGTADWPIRVQVTAGENTLSAAGTIADPAALKGFRLDVDADMPEIGAIAGLLASDVPAVPALQFDGTVAGGADEVSLSGFTLTAGGSDLGGDVTLSLGGARPALAGELRSRRLDVGKFMPPSSDEPEETEGEAPIPFDLLDAAEVDLRLAIDELAGPGLSLSDLRGRVHVRDRQAELVVEQARLFDGGLTAELAMDGRADPAATRAEAELAGFDVGAMLQAFEVSEAVAGRADAALTMEGRGATISAILASSYGRATMDMGAGQIDNALAGLVGRSALTALLPIGDTDSASLNCAIGHFDLADGVATSTALLVDTERATIAGEGAVDLGGNRMDLVFSPRSKDPNLLALVAPVRLHGSLDAPEVTVMTGELVVDTAAGLLLGAINPLAIAIPFITAGSGDNQCLAALNDEMEADEGSVPERLVEGTVGVVGGVAEGVGDAATGVGEVLGDVGEGIGDALGGLFGGGD